MLLTITAEGENAAALSFLLHKHPDKLQQVELSVGAAYIFYPECEKEKVTAALLLDIDPIGMVRNAKNFAGKDFLLGQYVNDRPYVASSFMSSAISKAFSSAMNGSCKEYPEFIDMPLALTAKISVLPAPRGGELLIKRLFEPLGYTVEAERHLLDTQFSEWGYGKYFTLTLKNTLSLKELLSHLYVLIPVLDNEKHYFITQNEVEKLLQKGKGWLEQHPEREIIVSRYLINLKSLVRSAFEVLQAVEDGIIPDTDNEAEQDELTKIEDTAAAHTQLQKVKKERLHDIRLKLVTEKLKQSGAASVIDLGCGDGKLLRLLLKEKQFTRIAGTDVSYSELEKSQDKLHWNEMPEKQCERLSLFQSSLTYRDKRFSGFDAAAVVEVIEHLDPNRLPALEKSLFTYAKPQTIVLTTPNREYNVRYENLSAGKVRHSDHRFEWTRSEFAAWAERVARENNYTVAFFPVGEEEENIGAPSQMAVFTYGN
ncbi:3' terminal RNA ribose 2'-O-methyltransferase Hen1 [Treponema sp. OMZ 803]|uniref:3' terminal RNA ribose 2'-O-methyltransferase Hen1 n=1 Tax=Treponema sp. OMZ 803 TaxID=120682 RepID=UPI0020A4BDDC|nr:3' terminal RNA ribose 2'-O-methyltransferase Hen1 [Treponema sp. OMZ 803]UTC52688.1 3' terminal RNA ribose 2'-O-methyltransferase Hen1 [Treponema sp. OMZ 803]